VAKVGGFTHMSESTVKREGLCSGGLGCSNAAKILPLLAAFFIEFADRIRPHMHSAKLAVTGGFRTLAGMQKALNERSCDIIGVARPLTAEPAFSAEIIEGRISAARTNKVPPPLQTPASIIQISQVRAEHFDPVLR
jgi:2,4-dienoyl-CoA reductase-like NADH-dependent reductase (Old Yellow Enzyme family)